MGSVGLGGGDGRGGEGRVGNGLGSLERWGMKRFGP